MVDIIHFLSIPIILFLACASQMRWLVTRHKIITCLGFEEHDNAIIMIVFQSITCNT